jgi:DNA (cytosine-5)-methyltransferase 1
MSKSFTTVSFFCGCGGLDLGFRGGFNYKGRSIPRLPFDIVSAFDNEEKCITTYKNNISNHAEVKDLSNYDPNEVVSADLLIGGFPCQEFSTAGPRKGLKSERGRLYKALIKYIKTHSPKIVIGENVPGLANIDDGKALKTITSEIEDAGYTVQVWTLYGPNYGLPQRRTRLFIVGVRNDLPGFPTAPRIVYQENNFKSTRWAIEDLEQVDCDSVANQSQYFKASPAKKGNGQGDEITPADLPSYTIRANAKSRVQFHYRLKRRLTVRECARLQGFPDNFAFPHSATTNIMQIGNAVPPLLANVVAKSIAKYLNELHEQGY